VGPEARSLIDPDSDSRNNSVFDKVRQPEGCVEPLRPQSGNTNTEALPSGYVKKIFLMFDFHLSRNFLMKYDYWIFICNVSFLKKIKLGTGEVVQQLKVQDLAEGSNFIPACMTQGWKFTSRILCL
jgi:hypothetical protein